jgi:hypothetical protein
MQTDHNQLRRALSARLARFLCRPIYIARLAENTLVPNCQCSCFRLSRILSTTRAQVFSAQRRLT